MRVDAHVRDFRTTVAPEARLLLRLAIGFAIYFTGSRFHSRLRS